MRAKHSQLTALKIQRLKEPGRYLDGLGLMLQVRAGKEPGSINKSWIYRYATPRGERQMGLGIYPHVTLAEAREKAVGARKLREQGLDPIDVRRTRRASLAAANTMTFDDCARAFIAEHSQAWRNPRHRDQWSETIRRYASPIIGKLPVSAIDTALIERVLRQPVGNGDPFWRARFVTASRLRGRIEQVLGWATVHRHRSGDNPARWRGHLEHLLGDRSKAEAKKHLAALSYVEMPAFLGKLRTQGGCSARALEFQILTACRPGEVRLVRWAEFDLDKATWAIPSERTKRLREHLVPLSDRAIAILCEQRKVDFGGEFVFFGDSRGRPLHVHALLQACKRVRPDITAHGFRSAFRTWAGECTNFPREVCELALGHAVGDATEQAYQRGHLLERRRAMMIAWAEFCTGA